MGVAVVSVLPFAAGAFVAGAEFAFEFASTAGAEFAFASAVFALASVIATGASAGASGLLESTETLPVNAGIASNRADSMKAEAATIVTFDKTVAVPRGASAELDTLLVNKAPASVLPGCNRTAATRTRQDKKKIPYKK